MPKQTAPAKRVGHVDGTYHWCTSCERRMHHSLWSSVDALVCNPCKNVVTAGTNQR